LWPAYYGKPGPRANQRDQCATGFFAEKSKTWPQVEKNFAISQKFFVGDVEIGKGQASLGHDQPVNMRNTMTFEVTPLYALPLALIYLILWVRISAIRAGTKISFGDGGNVELLRRVRQHGNFVEWTCFVLILMILAEGMGAPALYLHIGGALLLIGRIAHPFGLQAIDNAAHPMRYLGNSTNILATLNLMICIGVNLLGL
jgi:uncharacterized protein